MCSDKGSVVVDKLSKAEAQEGLELMQGTALVMSLEHFHPS